MEPDTLFTQPPPTVKPPKVNIDDYIAKRNEVISDLFYGGKPICDENKNRV